MAALRILLDYRPALRERTGVGEFVHEVARALIATAEPGESLTLFSSSRKDRLAPDVVPGARTIDRRVSVRGLNFAWHRIGAPSIERLTGETFDVVQGAHPLLIPSRRAARLITIADLDFLDHPERARAEIRRDYPRLVTSHAARADHVIVISAFTADETTRRLHVPAERLTICRPGAPDWKPRDAEPRHGHILFLGTLDARKNLGALLDAYAALRADWPDAPPLVLAGHIARDASSLIERTRGPAFGGRVSAPGYVGDDRRRELFRDALAFVLPSHTEGFGMPVLEAMATGVPVIAANRGALPEVVGQAGRLFDADDVPALARALKEVLTDDSARRRMREAGLAQTRRFQWRDAAQAMRGAWHKALAHRKARARG